MMIVMMNYMMLSPSMVDKYWEDTKDNDYPPLQNHYMNLGCRDCMKLLHHMKMFQVDIISNEVEEGHDKIRPYKQSLKIE